MLDGASPPPSGSLGSVVATEAAALQAIAEVADEANCLQAQLEAMRAAMAKSEQEVVATEASRAEAQAQLLGRCHVPLSRGVLS